MSKWIEFVKTDKHPNKKTEVWMCWSKNDGSFLGEVKWHGAWRQYTFHTHCRWNTVWNTECLQDLSNFVANMTRLHRDAKHKEALAKQQKLLHIWDAGEDGPLCGAGVGYTVRKNEPGATCVECLAIWERVNA